MMLDLHCHILPGVDDGAANLTESLAMARCCVQDGITHIAATPHCNRGYRWLRANILPLVAQLNQALGEAGLPLTILPGSEIQVWNSAIYRREYESGIYCHLGDRPTFTLLEFSWKASEYPPDAVELVHWLRDRGTTPIIAHPERHKFFAEHPGRIAALTEAGAWLQITVDSLLGNHGHDPQVAGTELVRAGYPALLSTDAHNLHRCSGMAPGYAWLAEHFGAETAGGMRARSDQVLAAIGVQPAG